MIERLTSLFDERMLEPELLRLIDGPRAGIAVAAVAVLTAAGIGVVHAIGPGHGKALIGAYLASTRGRPRDAVALGALVAGMHTVSVLALGIVLAVTQRAPTMRWVQPALTLVSAVAVASVGVFLVRRALAQRRDARGRRLVAASGGPTAGHGHDHHHGPLPDGVAPLSRGGVVAIATSGGLLPSPAAFLVLATAMALERTAFGLALVGAFGVGLAGTLTVVGLAVLWGRDRAARASSSRWLGWLSAVAPLVGAWVVLAGGVLLAVGALLRW